MDLSNSSVRVSFPLFGVTHGLEIFLNFHDFLLFIGWYFEPINSLKKIDLFVKGLFECSFSLLFCQRLVVLNFLQFGYSPHLKLLVKYFEIILSFWVSSSLNLLFVSKLLSFSKLVFLLQLFLVLLYLLVL